MIGPFTIAAVNATNAKNSKSGKPSNLLTPGEIKAGGQTSWLLQHAGHAWGKPTLKFAWVQSLA